jgi:hypothetical protein
MKKNKIISDWLEEHGDPEICKQVERKLEEITKERSNQIIDEVYNKYTKKYVGYDDVPSKELFLFEIKNNPDFSERWGLKIEERELSLEERYKIALPIWKEKYGLLANMMVPTNVDNTPYKIPTKLITITYNDIKIESYV